MPGSPNDVSGRGPPRRRALCALKVVILDQGGAKVFEGTPAELTADEGIALRFLGVGLADA